MTIKEVKSAQGMRCEAEAEAKIEPTAGAFPPTSKARTHVATMPASSFSSLWDNPHQILEWDRRASRSVFNWCQRSSVRKIIAEVSEMAFGNHVKLGCATDSTIFSLSSRHYFIQKLSFALDGNSHSSFSCNDDGSFHVCVASWARAAAWGGVCVRTGGL
jgi:hypothetical protein